MTKAVKFFLSLSAAGMLLALPGAFAQISLYQPVDIRKETDLMGLGHRVPEARQVLLQGAEIVNLPRFNTFAVIWFPQGYALQPVKRTLFSLHGGLSGNAYQTLNLQLEQAKKHQYGVVSLQWETAGRTLEPAEVQEAVADLMPYLVSRYGVFPHLSGLETYDRSAELAYEIAFWDRLKRHNFYRIVISQSGGMALEPTRPVIAQMVSRWKRLNAPPPVQPVKPPATAAKEKPKPPAPWEQAISEGRGLEGKRFFLYCGEKDELAGMQTCEAMKTAMDVIQTQGGTIARFLRDPAGTRGGLTGTPEHEQAKVQSFLVSTSPNALVTRTGTEQLSAR